MKKRLCFPFGSYVIVRSRVEGINAGFLLEATHHGCFLQAARRLYFHEPADKGLAWYEGVAVSGPSEATLMSAAVDKYIIEDYSVTVCTSEAAQMLQDHPPHSQADL